MSEVKVNKISPRTNCGTTQLGDAGDTITVTGDLKSNSLKSASGSTITLGQSGDTIQLGCGATQTGFGRTGTVNWDTTAKTASFTAVSGNGYFVNTTSGAITVTMPASPSAGDIVGIKDYAGTFSTNNVTVGRNGSNFDGAASDPVLSTDQLSVFFVYVDGTQGWKTTQNDSGSYGAAYVSATGGCITTCGDYKIHVFTGPGTFCVSCGGNASGSNTVDYLVVGGGASGGGTPVNSVGGGGGAGGFRVSSTTYTIGCAPAAPLTACVSALPVTAQGYPITVGAGGATQPSPAQNGIPGSNSIFSSITSTGGGGGGTDASPTSGGSSVIGAPVSAPGGYAEGLPGGSGGGTRGTYLSPGATPTNNRYYNPSVSVLQNGNTPPVSPPQGNPGGQGFDAISVNSSASGGGGAGTPGFHGRGPGNGNDTAGAGGTGVGLPADIALAKGIPSGCYQYFAGGGGGGTDATPSVNASGGLGGGGAGGGTPGPARPAGSGTANTGGGGGGKGDTGSASGTGGSGIVIIRYKFQ